MSTASQKVAQRPVQAYASDEYDEARAARNQKNAPGTWQGVEGVNDSGSKQESVAISVPSGKRARKARARNARRRSVAADHRIVIEDVPAPGIYLADNPTKTSRGQLCDPRELFSADELASMPLVIRKTPSGARARVWRSHDGTWYRCGGYLRIEDVNGRRVFQITLSKGANLDDLAFLRREVDRLRTGNSRRTWRGVVGSLADERTLVHEFRHRPYADPYLNRDPSPRVRVCEEPKCRDQWHGDYDAHTLDAVSHDTDDGSYSIAVRRERNASTWCVTVYADDFYGTPKDVSAFVNDLQWMRAECERANSVPLHAEATS